MDRENPYRPPRSPQSDDIRLARSPIWGLLCGYVGTVIAGYVYGLTLGGAGAAMIGLFAAALVGIAIFATLAIYDRLSAVRTSPIWLSSLGGALTGGLSMFGLVLLSNSPLRPSLSELVFALPMLIMPVAFGCFGGLIGSVLAHRPGSVENRVMDPLAELRSNADV